MPNKIKVKVTQQCINEGIPEDPSCCPIALAISGGDNRQSFIAVNPQHVTLDFGAYYTLPIEAIGFIEDFDSGKAVAPFEFEMTQQEEV